MAQLWLQFFVARKEISVGVEAGLDSVLNMLLQPSFFRNSLPVPDVTVVLNPEN